MSSIAAAEGSTREGSDPKTQATSMHRVGRTRLPPASIEYRMASSRPSRRRSSVKRSPLRYSSKVRRCASQRDALRVGLAPRLALLSMPNLPVRPALRAAQNATHERRRLFAREPLGQLHGLVDGHLRGHVLDKEHLVEREAQDRAVHSVHPVYRPTLRDLGEQRVQILPLLLDPARQPYGVLLEISPVRPPAH